jgi:hypothetical protein
MNMEQVEMRAAPDESPPKNLMGLGEAGSAADQEAPPYQLAHIPKHHSELIKFCHLSSLPDVPRKPHHPTPGFYPLSLPFISSTRGWFLPFPAHGSK